jgi:hypothetical protein
MPGVMFSFAYAGLPNAAENITPGLWAGECVAAKGIGIFFIAYNGLGEYNIAIVVYLFLR